MPSSYTTSLRLTLPATGELAGQWGNTVNTGITELLDAAVAGTASISTWGGSGVAYTLSNNSGTADEARRMFIVATGTPGEAKNVICPAVSKFYVFRNDTTGGFALTLKTSGGTGIAVPAGQYKLLYCDGTNVVETFNSAGALTLSGALSVGGTATFAANPTLSAGTANQVQYLNASKVLVGSANLTFDGTALTLGGNPTVSAGTANGVTYLNGSKVLTTGSALTFDGTVLTNTGRVKVGGAGNNAQLEVAASSGEVFRADASAGAFRIVANQTDLLLQGSSSIQSWINGSEQMRLTSTGLGIGTSSPLSKLVVSNGSNKNLEVQPGATTYLLAYDRTASDYLNLDISGQILTFSTDNGTERMRLDSSGNLGIGTSSPGAKLDVFGSVFISSRGSGFAFQTPDWRMYNTSSGNALVWDNYTTEFMRLDSSGNLGLGVTPSAWGTTKALEFSYGAFSANSSVGTDVSGNCYYNGTNWIYRVTGVALRYNQATAGHSWHVASGTAGNAISFTQAMTLDASSRLGIKQTSPTVDLDVGANDNTVAALSVRYSTVPAYLSNSFDGTVGLTTLSANSYNTSSGSASWSAFQNTGYGNAAVQIASGTGGADIRFLTAAAANTNPTERARITSGGDLLVGTTSQPVSGITTRLAVVQSTGDYSQVINNTNASPYGLYIKHNTDSNGAGNPFIVAIGNATTRFAVRSDGGIENYSANNVNLSDRREKTNFAPAKPYLDTICAIPVQTFNYIDQSEDDPGLTLGVVAQDVQAVAPELVMESNWGTAEEPKMRLSIYQTDLQYALMKCVQELKAQNDDLRARVAALEA